MYNTGMTKTSHDSETPAQGQQVITAVALICYNFDGVIKVFLPKRADTKKFLPGIYELPGGHIDFGENIVTGLKRELKEELEIDVKIGDPFAVFDYTNPIKGSHSVEIIYFASLLGSPDDIVLHQDDHSSSVLVTKDGLHLVANDEKGEDDPEFRAIKKAFSLLEGNSPDFAVLQ